MVVIWGQHEEARGGTPRLRGAQPIRRGANAPSAGGLAAAQELAAVLNGESMTQMRAAIMTQVWTSVEAQIAPRADAATLADMRGEFERAVADLSGNIMKDAPAIYARHFTEQELRDILVFYKSPAGSKALKVMPTVLTDVSKQIAPRMQQMQTDLNTRIQTIMLKHGYGK
jgi:hypothetical protein